MVNFLNKKSSTKSFLTNAIALVLLVLGWYWPEPHVMAVGSYALSGAITNWLAITMLFEKIPFLYGSGVIPNHFEGFKQGSKRLIMDQFFTRQNLSQFFEDSMDSEIHQIDLNPILNIIDYDQLFQSLIDTIAASSLGSMLSFIGGTEALQPLKAPFIKALQEKLSDLAKQPELTALLANKQQSFFHPEVMIEKVSHIVDQRLNELTPQMVKLIIQHMIREHLGWLVVWGGIFGGLIGLFLSLTS